MFMNFSFECSRSSTSIGKVCHTPGLTGLPDVGLPDKPDDDDIKQHAQGWGFTVAVNDPLLMQFAQKLAAKH